MAINIFDQISVEELIRDVGEEVIRLLQQVMENNKKILNLQKQLIALQEEDVKKRRSEQERE